MSLTFTCHPNELTLRIDISNQPIFYNLIESLNLNFGLVFWRDDVGEVKSYATQHRGGQSLSLDLASEGLQPLTPLPQNISEMSRNRRLSTWPS